MDWVSLSEIRARLDAVLVEDVSSAAPKQSPSLVELDAKPGSLHALIMAALDAGRTPVLRLFKTDNGRIIAWPADDMTHAQARDDLRLGDLRMQHGMFRFGQKLQDVQWYDTTGKTSDNIRLNAAKAAAGV